MHPMRDLWPIVNTEGLGSDGEAERKNRESIAAMQGCYFNRSFTVCASS
jgi:hypothetical protein